MITKPVPALLYAPPRHGPTNHPNPELAQALAVAASAPFGAASFGAADTPGPWKAAARREDVVRPLPPTDGLPPIRGEWGRPRRKPRALRADHGCAHLVSLPPDGRSGRPGLPGG